MFERFPWIHLRMTETEIIELCAREGIRDPAGRYPMDVHVKYMLNPRYFNMTAAGRYLNSCRALPDVEVTENSLALDPEELLTSEIYGELSRRATAATSFLQ